MTIWDTLREHWLKQNVAVSAGMSNRDIELFERRNDFTLSSELRDYFHTVNGMADCSMDVDLFSFLPLDRCQRMSDVLKEWGWTEPANADEYLVVVDYLIGSHYYAVRQDAVDSDLNNVILFGQNVVVPCAMSFTSFVARYLSDPDLLL